VDAAAAAADDDDDAAPTFSFAILAAAAAWPSDEHAVVAARTAETSKPADVCSDPRAKTAAAAAGARVGCVAIPEEALLHPLLGAVAAADLLRLLPLAEEGTNTPSRSRLRTAEDNESAEGRTTGHRDSQIRLSSGVAAGIGCRYRRRPCRVIHCGDVRRAAVAGPVGGDVEVAAASHCLSFSSCSALLLLPAIDLDFSARPLLSMANLRSDDDDDASSAAAHGNARSFVPLGACDAPLPQAWEMPVRSASWSWQ